MKKLNLILIIFSFVVVFPASMTNAEILIREAQGKAEIKDNNIADARANAILSASQKILEGEVSNIVELDSRGYFYYTIFTEIYSKPDLFFDGKNIDKEEKSGGNFTINLTVEVNLKSLRNKLADLGIPTISDKKNKVALINNGRFYVSLKDYLRKLGFEVSDMSKRYAKDWLNDPTIPEKIFPEYNFLVYAENEESEESQRALSIQIYSSKGKYKTYRVPPLTTDQQILSREEKVELFRKKLNRKYFILEKPSRAGIEGSMVIRGLSDYLLVYQLFEATQNQFEVAIPLLLYDDKLYLMNYRNNTNPLVLYNPMFSISKTGDKDFKITPRSKSSVNYPITQEDFNLAEREPNFGFYKANPLRANVKYFGKLDSRGDKDYFQVLPSISSGLTINIEASSDPKISPIIKVLDANYVQLAEAILIDGESNLAILAGATPKWIIIEDYYGFAGMETGIVKGIEYNMILLPK